MISKKGYAQNILLFILHSYLILKCSLSDWFNDNSEVACFLLGHPVYSWPWSWSRKPCPLQCDVLMHTTEKIAL